MGMKDGAAYRRRLDEREPEVWLAGERVEGALSRHPAFRGLVATQSALYDLQCEEGWRSLMGFRSPDSGEWVGLSYLQPRTREDLERRRVMGRLWAERHHGMLGRCPDYMNTAVMVLGAAAELFGEADPAFARHARDYYAYCRENDVTLSHAFLHPPIGRTDSAQAARAVEKTSTGLRVSGAFLLATQAAAADEILVFPLPVPPASEPENPHALAFAVPVDAPGLRLLCREPLPSSESRYDYPLSSRFEESDALLVFDRVLVPWERVFLYGRSELADRFFAESHFYPHIMHMVTGKNIVKTEFLLGVAQRMIDTLGIGRYDSIREKVADLIAGLETMKGLQLAAEHDAFPDRWGSLVPHPDPMLTASYLFPKLYPVYLDLLQRLGASNLVLTPTERDFQSEVGTDWRHWLQAGDLDGYGKVRLFRLAQELCASAFGARQSLYERFFFGDPTKLAARLYAAYDRQRLADQVDEFLEMSDGADG